MARKNLTEKLFHQINRSIKAQVKDNAYNSQVIASFYEVNRSTVSTIKRVKTWPAFLAFKKARAEKKTPPTAVATSAVPLARSTGKRSRQRAPRHGGRPSTSVSRRPRWDSRSGATPPPASRSPDRPRCSTSFRQLPSSSPSSGWANCRIPRNWSAASS